MVSSLSDSLEVVVNIHLKSWKFGSLNAMIYKRSKCVLFFVAITLNVSRIRSRDINQKYKQHRCLLP